MPGLIRGVARTAVIAGTATHVSNNVSRRQAARWNAQQPQQPQQQQYEPPPPAPAPAPAPPASSSSDRIAALQQLAELKAAGVLTDAEFELEKSKILAS
jgi:hypothetical protein